MNNPIYRYHQIPWQAANFYTYPNEINYPLNNLSNNSCVSSAEILQQPNNSTLFNYIVNIPLSTAKSMEGKYFAGTAFDIYFGEATNGWARLYNPPNSGVNLYVNVWRVSDIDSTPYKVQIWFNSTPPGIIQESASITPLNTTISPPPQSRAIIQHAVGVKGFPTSGDYVFGTSRLAGITIEDEVQGRYIFPPGGSLTVFLSNPARPTIPTSARVTFGWWEEAIQ